MAIILKRQISNDEKEQILKRFGKNCYATGHPIPETEEVQYDHIKAFATHGTSEIDNIAPMCKKHNLQKGRLPLEDFRTKLKMEEFFTTGNSLTLKHELEFFREKKEIPNFGESIIASNNINGIVVEINNKNKEFPLYECPITNWKYFYAILPVELINSDDDEDDEIGLQPRYLIQDKVFNLYRHFQRHPVLQPSIARIKSDKLLVFDGQHKIAALLWDGRREFELKVYITPDAHLLNQTNIAAHDKFAQTRFYSSIMVAKLGSQFGKLFEEYKNQDDDSRKSEIGFVNFLKTNEQLTTAEVNKRFRSFLYNAVLDEDTNQLTKLISKGNRSTDEFPLTMDMLSKSILSNFLYQYPIDEELISKHYLRDVELNNLITLCNILYEEILFLWDSNKNKSDQNQIKLKRIIRSKSIMSWSEILKDAVAAKLELFDSDEKAMLFYRNISEEDFKKIRNIVRRFSSWSLWSIPENSEIDRVLSDNKNVIKKFFKEKGLTTGYLLGAPE